MKIKLTCESFGNGKRIPVEFTSDGTDLSPPLQWSAVPEGTAELALIVDDPDAPSAEPWVHWVIYRIPPGAQGLPQGVSPDLAIRGMEEVLQGRNSWGSIGYRGPAPPRGHGRHRYVFKIYAVDRVLPLKPGMDKRSLLHALSGHILAEGELSGTYERK
ncbi:YbhB/YbcL family Raf kinase inhibitor-like protein [Candidatus Sumerlaeota bacterium]|nr:YbhB/YbcL family Raf kinase inhibitor-like protein [Candidatus Sumerlaeota bacterium]